MDRHCPFSPFDFDYNSGSFITDSEPSSVHLKQIDQTLAFGSQPRYPQILKKFMPVPGHVNRSDIRDSSFSRILAINHFTWVDCDWYITAFEWKPVVRKLNSSFHWQKIPLFSSPNVPLNEIFI